MLTKRNNNVSKIIQEKHDNLFKKASKQRNIKTKCLHKEWMSMQVFVRKKGK